ncbi:glycoside hydrolase superfamily [Mycena pura]|uniref:Glycoside hydrolase superfamily n=1 Tax=Mycena pura TaxID=153505 RepID=A0AAD6V628_9AGAR|nr:glycoside hydrolase superfamily [Mycena pura]
MSMYARERGILCNNQNTTASSDSACFYRDFTSCKPSNGTSRAEAFTQFTGSASRSCEFDQKGGAKEELIAVIKKAKENSIVSYVDAVLNHRFGADRIETFAAVEVDNDDRTKEILTGTISRTGFDFSGPRRQAQQNDIHIQPLQGRRLQRRKPKDLNIVDHNHPDVRADLVIHWGKWVTEELGAGGFRFDAVKHIDHSFIADFVKSVRAETNKPKMFAVGEYWKESITNLEEYLDALETQFSVFDAPLHYNFKEADCASFIRLSRAGTCPTSIRRLTFLPAGRVSLRFVFVMAHRGFRAVHRPAESPQILVPSKYSSDVCHFGLLRRFRERSASARQIKPVLPSAVIVGTRGYSRSLPTSSWPVPWCAACPEASKSAPHSYSGTEQHESLQASLLGAHTRETNSAGSTE